MLTAFHNMFHNQSTPTCRLIPWQCLNPLSSLSLLCIIIHHLKVPAARRLHLGTTRHLNCTIFRTLDQKTFKVRQRPNRSLEMATWMPWGKFLCHNVWWIVCSYLNCLAYTRSFGVVAILGFYHVFSTRGSMQKLELFRLFQRWRLCTVGFLYLFCRHFVSSCQQQCYTSILYNL